MTVKFEEAKVLGAREMRSRGWHLEPAPIEWFAASGKVRPPTHEWVGPNGEHGVLMYGSDRNAPLKEQHDHITEVRLRLRNNPDGTVNLPVHVLSV